ncbi:g1133 [Coccomyxa elongata]
MTEANIESAGNHRTTLCREFSFASTILLLVFGSLIYSEHPGHVISTHYHRNQIVCPFTLANIKGGEKAEFCKYEPPALKVCSPAQLSRLHEYFLGRASNGSQWAEGMLRLSPCDIWPHIMGRTLWLLGDSTTEHFMLALECFFIGWYELETSEHFDGRTPASNNTEAMEKASGWDGGQSAMVQPWCILLPKDTRICFIRANTGLEWTQKVLPVFWGLGAQPHDIIVGNFGLWAWGEPALQDDLDALQRWVHNTTRRPFMIWRETSPQYFSTETGDFYGAVKPYQCQPIGGREDTVQLLPDGSLCTQEQSLQVVLEGNWRNKASTAVVEALGIPVMRIWNESVPLWEFHYESIRNLDGTMGVGEDCTHSCHPSTYQIWIYSLYRVLSEYQDMLPQKQASEINGGGEVN